MSVNPGSLRDRVTVQTSTRTQSVGGTTVTWADDRATWARVIQTNAEGRARYQQAGYTHVTHEVVMRDQAFTLAGHRLVWGARVLEPLGPPLRPTRERFMVIACREVTDAKPESGSSGESSG